MSSAPAPQEIWRDARWLAQAVDPNAGLVRFVEMSAEDYREASFLDDRMFEKPRNSYLLKWDQIADAMPADARTDARWIFHIGHVGSTLIARLLGELEGVLSIREPRAFRDLLPRVPRDGAGGGRPVRRTPVEPRRRRPVRPGAVHGALGGSARRRRHRSGA